MNPDRRINYILSHGIDYVREMIHHLKKKKKEAIHFPSPIISTIMHQFKRIVYDDYPRAGYIQMQRLIRTQLIIRD